MHEKEGNQTNKIRFFAELCVISFEMYNIFPMLNAELEKIKGNVGWVL